MNDEPAVMTPREAKMKALHLAWQVVDALAVDIMVNMGGEDQVSEEDDRKIRLELDKIAQRLFDRLADLQARSVGHDRHLEEE